MELLLAVLVINVGFTILYVITERKRNDHTALIFVAMFLFVPIFGFAVYFLPQFIYKITHKQNSYDRDDLILFQEKEQYVMKPKLEEELNIVPFQEALAIGKADEKRALLLGILKKDMMNNTQITQFALNDIDSETSHYAAAATMEVYRKMKLGIQELEAEIKNDPQNFELQKQLLDQIYEYVKSGVLSERDRMVHINTYIARMNAAIDQKADALPTVYYVHQIDFLMETNRLHEAETLAKQVKEKGANEEIYLKLLEIYFELKNEREFYNTFTELKDSEINLSSKGMEAVRFWMSRGN